MAVEDTKTVKLNNSIDLYKSCECHQGNQTDYVGYTKNRKKKGYGTRTGMDAC